MSDGPHRSLPMRRHWKQCAERAANYAFSTPEFEEALQVSLSKDLSPSLAHLRVALIGKTQSKLFPDERCLDSLRSPGFFSAQSLSMIDGAKVALGKGLDGKASLQSAIEAAVFAHTRSIMRSMEEHYLRCGKAAACNRLTRRFQSAMAPAEVHRLASRLIAGGSQSRVVRRSLDQGPAL